MPQVGLELMILCLGPPSSCDYRVLNLTWHVLPLLWLPRGPCVTLSRVTTMAGLASFTACCLPGPVHRACVI